MRIRDQLEVVPFVSLGSAIAIAIVAVVADQGDAIAQP